MEKKKTNWKKWAKGLLSAFITGLSAGAGVMLAEPETFNVAAGLGSLLKVCVISGVVGALAYLKQAPLPEQDPQ